MYWTYCDTADISETMLRQAYDQMTPSRRAHIDRFRRDEDRIRSLTGEILAKRLLQEHYGQKVIDRKPNGQPYVPDSSLYVSIAHCDRLVACAVSGEPVGIDVERIRAVDRKICQRVCVEQEMAYIREAPQEAEYRFFEIWTGKEAYFKKCGTGITDLKSVNVLTLRRQVYTVADYLIQIVF